MVVQEWPRGACSGGTGTLTCCSRGGSRSMPDDFLTPAHAVGAALLLAADPDSRVLELIRDSLDARPYLPELSPTEWEAEALQLIEELVQRRERWAVEKRSP